MKAVGNSTFRTTERLTAKSRGGTTEMRLQGGRNRGEQCAHRKALGGKDSSTFTGSTRSQAAFETVSEVSRVHEADNWAGLECKAQ